MIGVVLVGIVALGGVILVIGVVSQSNGKDPISITGNRDTGGMAHEIGITMIGIMMIGIGIEVVHLVGGDCWCV